MPTTAIESDWTLRWNAGIAVLDSGDAYLAILFEGRQHLLDDALLVAIVRLTGQPASTSALIQQLCPAETEAAVLECVNTLLISRILVSNHSHLLTRNSIAFWDTISSHGPKINVSVDSLLPNLDVHLASQLRANGVTVEAGSELRLLATDHYRRPEIAAFARETGTLVLAKPVGRELWFGPCLSPASGICWECLNFWLRLHAWPELSVTGLEPSPQLPRPEPAWLPATTAASCALISQMITLLAAGEWKHSNDLWIFDFHTFQPRVVPVIPRKNCVTCQPDAQSVSLAALRNPLTGILQEEPIVSGLVGSLYLAHASALMPLGEPGVRRPVSPLPVDGKGASPPEALLRCTMEAVERYSTAFTGGENLIFSAASEIPALTPAELLLFHPSQLDERDEWNAGPGTLHGMPEPFDNLRPTHWVKAQSLIGRPGKYVPAGYAWLWYPFDGQPFYNFADTNGCAAGISLQDATLRALLELIERDALAIWWYNRLRRPSVPLNAMNLSEVAAARALFAEHNRSLEVLDLTHDLKIPVYAAISSDKDGKHIYLGCSAATCPVDAVKQSISELIQFWYWELQLGTSIDRQLWFNRGSLHNCEYLKAVGEAELPVVSAHDRSTALKICLDSIEKAGLEAFAIDLTRPELGIPVVRCIVPGLRHYGPRFAPGRLYDVPVSMGWLGKPRSIQELNPCPCVL